jgi:asparagine N-glycosylation enzyme membrane subunit Stt3
MAAMDANGKREAGSARQKALTAGILLGCFVLAMVIRCAFYYGPAVAPVDTYGSYHYVVSGNDPDYHKRSIDYALETGHALTWDPLMNYPNGGPNPNPPAFAWSGMLMGIVLSPFFNFDVQDSVWLFFEISPAFWAALTIIPLFFFARDMFGRKPAYFACLFLSVMAGNVERTPLGFSDHDSFVMFFVVTGFFFLMRAMKNLEDKNYVKSWGKARDISEGIIEFFSTQKVAVLYAMMASISIAAVMLAWKGATYISAILFMYFFIHAWIKRFRKEDPLGIAILTLLVMGLPMLISFPYYYSMQFVHWLETPFFVFVAASVIAAIIVLTRDYPWMMVLGGIVVLAAGAYTALYFYMPSLYNIVLGFQGYFIRTKLYETIAEAQPPDFSRMVFSYGEYIFYFALIALIYSVYRLPKERYRNDYIFTIMWCLMSIFMAMSAVRFMYNATPVFAILGGWVTWTIIDLLDYKKMVKTFRGLSGGSKWHAVKSSVKLRHVAGAIFIGYMVVGSTVFYGLDAGVPYETKKEWDNSIYNTLPSFLQPKGYETSSSTVWWFGSFGTAFPSDYWIDGMYWFQKQDTNSSPEDRPAFVAWWDYGHWCMHMGEHPSIADNFQQGVEISGNIITAQNESAVIAYYIARVAEGSTTDASVKAILNKYLGPAGAKDFIDIEEMKDIPHWRSEIKKNEDVYGKHTAEINDLNVKWTALRGLLATKLTKDELVNMYDEVCQATNHEIRYFAADSRMFPFQARNTGIYYAPVKLSDQDINDFMVVKAVGNDGVEYDPANIPTEQRNDKDFKIVDYTLYYLQPFYDSFFYKAYIGYGPTDLGMAITDGIPSMAGNMRTGQYIPMQGWNMSNFKLEYRNYYWNPYNETAGLANHTDAWKIVPPDTAQKYTDDKNGVVDGTYRSLYQGVFFLKYYHGAYVNGTVTTSDGRPIPNARVTVFDDVKLAASYYPGIPHGYAITDANGKYSLLAPYGNVTIMVTNGGMESVDNALLETEKTVLAASQFNVSDDQAMRKNIDLNLDGILDYNIKKDYVVSASNLTGTAFFDENADASYTTGTDTPISGELTASNATLGLSFKTKVSAEGKYELHNLTPCEYSLSILSAGDTVDGGTVSVGVGTSDTKDMALNNVHLEGYVAFENGTGAGGLKVGVYASDGELSRSNATLENGSYFVERILPGNYTVSISSGGYLREMVPIEINQSANFTLNLTAYPMNTVSGRINYTGGAPASGASVSFQDSDNMSRSVTVITDTAGKYNAEIARGNYTALARQLVGVDMWVDLAGLEAPRASELNMTLVKGVRLNGTVYRDLNGNGSYDELGLSALIGGGTGAGSPGGDISGGIIPGSSVAFPELQASPTIALESSKGTLLLPGNSAGYYEAYLPPGNYLIRGIKVTNETESFINTTSITLTTPTVLNISITKGVQVDGKVFWDRNGDEIPDDLELVDGARLLFKERRTPSRTIVVTSAANGSYVAHLSPIIDYEVELTAKGYAVGSDDISTGTVAVSRNFKIYPAKVAMTAELKLDGKAAPAGIAVLLKTSTTGAEGANLTTDSQGRIMASLVPGDYLMVVSQNVTTAERGLVNCSLAYPFALSFDQQAVKLEPTITLKVYLSGTIYYDENGDAVPQRAEYRNSLVKMVSGPDATDPSAGAAGIPYLPSVLSQNTVDGKYEIAVEPGTYTLWSQLSLATPDVAELVYIENISVEKTGTANIKLVPGCQIRGLVHVDLNSNSAYDAGESRGAVNVTVMSGSKVLLTVASDASGWYELVLPRGTNYTMFVDSPTEETVGDGATVPIRYMALKDLAVPDAAMLERNLTVRREISTVGTVAYDRNGNGVLDDNEGVANATVTLMDTATAGKAHNATTNSTGYYSLYVEQGTYNISISAPGYNATVASMKSAVLALDNRDIKLSLEALNTTVRVNVFLNSTYPAVPSLPGGADIVLRALDSRGANFTGSTDVNGRMTASLKPGIYSLYITGSDRQGGKLAYFGPLDVEPSGTDVQAEARLVHAVRVWGSSTYKDINGVQIDPSWVNFTFNTTLSLGGSNYTAGILFGGQKARYELYMPVGNFSVNASYETVQYGLNVSFRSAGTVDINATESVHQWDAILNKVMDLSLGLKWDETQKVTIAANGTANYTLLLSNNGNEKTVVNLDITKPNGWDINLDLDKVTLAVGENVTVKLNMKAYEKANAGDNVITIKASSADNPTEFSNVSSPMVNIIQYYDVDVTESTAVPSTIVGGMTYSFKLKNSGNGLDTFNITLTGPHGWNMTVSDWNPQLSGGEEREIPVTVQPFSGARIEKGMTFRVSATSKNELAPSAELNINLTFPKLSVGNVKAVGPGVSAPKTNWMPGFEGIGLLAAACVAYAIFQRRRVQ